MIQKRAVFLAWMALLFVVPNSQAQSSNAEREAECVARLKAMGLEHGVDACKKKPKAEVVDEVQDLPKKCVAESPRDRPCQSYGGTYRLRISPDDSGPSCLGTKPIETTIRLKASSRYGGSGKHSWELGALITALGFKKPDPRLGSAVREGVCCIDVDLFGNLSGKERRLRLSLARGLTAVNAKAEVTCDEPGDFTPLKAQATLVGP